MLDIIRNPRYTLILIAAAAVAVWFTLAVTGCSNAGDYVRVKTPEPIARAYGVAPTMTYNEAVTQMPITVNEAQTWFTVWGAEIEERGRFVSFIQNVIGPQLVEWGTNAAGGAGMAWATPILIGLAGLGGFVAPSPGESKREKEAEDRGWDGAVGQIMATLGLAAPPIDVRNRIVHPAQA